MRDIMIDLETWGKRAGCAIRSIGAVAFDPTSGKLGDEFYVNVTKQSCLDVGLVTDRSTEKWWDQQTRDAQAALDTDQISLADALNRFSVFWRTTCGTRPWSQGANFDQPIIEAAYVACGLVNEKGDTLLPWKFYESRCTRTVYGLAGLRPFDFPKNTGTAHHALDDAKHQARCVSTAFRKLGLNH